MKNKGIMIGIFVLDAILIGVCAFLYLRQDRSVPVISFQENDIIYSDSIDPALLLEGVTAYDSQDGDVTDSLTIEKISDTSEGSVIITYTAVDRSNNVGKATRTLQIQPVPAMEETPEEISEKAAEEQQETETTPEEVPDAEQEDDNEGEQNPEESEKTQDGRAEARDDSQDQARRDEGRQPVRTQPDRNTSASAGQKQQNPEEGQTPAGADDDQVNGGRVNHAPVLILATDTITLPVGTSQQSVNWNDYIGQLSDDKDDRSQLFGNIVMEGNPDLSTPGTYPVVLYTRDSEGAESEHRMVNIRVE